MSRTPHIKAILLALALTQALPASAEFTIVGARIAEGDLWIIGRVNEPHTAITLDDSYTERSDKGGHFQFRIAYHPATCTVVLKTQTQSRVVVIANCGQRGPQGEAGPPGSPGLSASTRQSDPPSPERTPGLDIACSAMAALYEADKGQKLWVTRRGAMGRDAALSPLSGESSEIVLEVAVNGNLATAYGPDFASLVRGGPPKRLEAESGRSIKWSAKLDRLPEAVRIGPEDGAGAPDQFRFKQCGAVPAPKRDNRPARVKPSKLAPSSQTPSQEAPAPLPIPQGAIQE